MYMYMKYSYQFGTVVTCVLELEAHVEQTDRCTATNVSDQSPVS